MSKQEAEPPLGFEERIYKFQPTPYLDVEFKTKEELSHELAVINKLSSTNETKEGELYEWYRLFLSREELEDKLRSRHKEYGADIFEIDPEFEKCLHTLFLDGIAKEFGWGVPAIEQNELRKRTMYIFSNETALVLKRYYNQLRKHRILQQNSTLIHPFPKERDLIRNIKLSDSSNSSSSSAQGRRTHATPFRRRAYRKR